MVKTAILVSGGGITLQSLIDARIFGDLPNCELTAVISTKPEVYALNRAELAEIPTYVIERDIFPSATVFGFAILDKLRDLDIELVVLAGYEGALAPAIIKEYAGRIIDSYPSLMPAFTSGVQGDDVCPAVIEAGVKLTGATAYFVQNAVGSGAIILQKAVAVLEDDTPQSLQRRVLEEGETFVLPRAVSLFCEGKLKIEGHRVHVS